MIRRRLRGLLRLFRFELPFTAGAVALPNLLPIGIMDAVVIYAGFRLLRPDTTNPRTHIRAIYLSGSAAVLGFIFMRTLL